MERKQALIRISELAEELDDLVQAYLDPHRTHERSRMLEDIGEEVTDMLLTEDFAVGNPLYDDMDWALLREQKQWLLTVGGSHSDGLVCLLDMIQDQAVERGLSELEVFGREFND
jgi:hypothetical protein